MQLSAQDMCNAQYRIVHDLQMESYSIIKDETLPLFIRIRKSKKLAKQALKIAYEAIKENDCRKYSIIVDRIIELECQLGNPKNAKKIALQRLNKISPNWSEPSGSAYASDLGILSSISSYDKSNSFYKYVRKHKVINGVCGTTSYIGDVSRLYWKAKTLYNDYGQIYCLKFLKASTIIINEDKEEAVEIWDDIYSLLINSLSVTNSFTEMKSAFDSTEIQYKELRDWEKSMWEFNCKKSQYFVDFYGIKLYFKTFSCPDEKNQFKRCQPEDLEQLKSESMLYKKIIYMQFN